MTGEGRKATMSRAGGGGPRVIMLVGFSLLPLLALLILRAADVPLGQPFFLVYRYSPFPLGRAAALTIAVPVAAIGLWFLARGVDAGGVVRRWALLGAGAAFAAMVIWTFYAPPSYLNQRLFDLESPSHSGAFVQEARRVSSIRTYVSKTFYRRLKQSPEQMRGRRVLSNPAGMTVLFASARNAVASRPAFQQFLVDCFGLVDVEDSTQLIEFSSALLVAFLMTLFWGGAIVVAYALCRLWFAPLAAIAVALSCVLNPATLEFTPGKDTFQLCFVMLILYGWLAAYTKSRPWCAVVGGIATVASLMIGLIHAWVLLIVVSATFWDALVRGRVKQWAQSTCLPFSLAAGVAAAGVYVAFDWNVFRMAFAVAMRYRQMQVPIITDPFYWTLVGLPLFLLFVGPMLFALVGAMRRDVFDEKASLGRRMLVCTTCVLAFTYFFGNNNETPRLWIPFVVLLLVSLSLGRSTFRTESPRTKAVLLLLIGLQVGVTLVHWSLMDVRETEYRLWTKRMWD